MQAATRPGMLGTRSEARPKTNQEVRVRERARAQNPWLVLAVVCLGFVMILIDLTIVNIAVPSIMGGLHASLDQVLWAINAYLLVYAVLLVPGGRLGDLYGQRTLFVVGLLGFTAASAACGFAQDPTQLILARVAQGAGAGLLTPQALALVTTAFPEERRGLALGLFAGLNALAAIAGPVLGGYLITAGSWRWIFGINLPIGLAALAGSLLVLPGARARIRRSIDPVGMLLVGGGLLGIAYGLLEGERHQWGAIWGPVGIPQVIAGGVVLVGAFVAWEVRHQGGLLPLALLRRRHYAVGSVIAGLVSFSMLGFMLPLVLFLQGVLGLSALGTGYALIPCCLAMLVAAPLAGRAADRVGGKYLLLTGAVVNGLGIGLVIRAASVTATVHDLIVPMVVLGAGVGLIGAPLYSLVMAGIREEMVGAASGFVTAARQLGAVLGTAVVGGVLQNRLATAMHDQAVIYAGQLSAGSRGHFVAALSSAVSGGARQLGTAQAATGNDLMHRLAHDVLTHAYVQAMGPTLAVGITAMAVAALVSLVMPNLRTQKARGTEDDARRDPLVIHGANRFPEEA
jgi:EmrB/QacA subfamily drug resistance transporter